MKKTILAIPLLALLLTARGDNPTAPDFDNSPPTTASSEQGRYQVVPGRLDTATGPIYGAWRVDTFTGRTWWGRIHTYPMQVGTNVTKVDFVGWEQVYEDPLNAWTASQRLLQGTK